MQKALLEIKQHISLKRISIHWKQAVSLHLWSLKIYEENIKFTGETDMSTIIVEDIKTFLDSTELQRDHFLHIVRP